MPALHLLARRLQLLGLALLFSLCVALPAPRSANAASVVGSGTAASCTEAGLAAALAAGGTITFNCGPAPATIAITSEKLISSDTTLDGGGTVTLHGNGSTRILRSIDGTFNGTTVLKVINVTMSGLTIENGNTADQGGGIKVGFWNNFILRDSTLRNNRATKDDENCAGGGAIFIGGGSTARIERSVFSANQANNGGAINSLRTNLTILDSSFDGNQAIHTNRINQFPDCGGGGGLYIDGARAPSSGGPQPHIIQGSSFTNNTTNNHGGGLFAGLYPNESIQINRTTFDGNVVTKAASMSSSGTGGAIWYGSGSGSANNASFALTNSTIANNKAVGQGGGFWTSASATITNVTFYGNDATDSSITNPDDWRRGNGGALAVANNAPVAITNATFASNHSGFNGGAIAGKTITLKNTLFADNSTDWPIKIMQHCTDALIDGGNNMQYPPKNPNPNYFNETNCTNSITIASPQLGPLADNGGGTRTMALPNGSPAVNAGNNSTCPTTDQRGIARPQGAKCDIGAFELVLTLSLNPRFVEAGGPGFTLTVTGAGFTSSSKVLWNGQQRPTVFVSSTALRATIASADIAAVGNVQVNVGGSALPAVTLRVVQQVSRVYLPTSRR
jgi:predicted outer membrane repeat protein